MNRRKFFGQVAGALGLGAVAPYVSANATTLPKEKWVDMDEMIHFVRAVDTDGLPTKIILDGTLRPWKEQA